MDTDVVFVVVACMRCPSDIDGHVPLAHWLHASFQRAWEVLVVLHDIRCVHASQTSCPSLLRQVLLVEVAVNVFLNDRTCIGAFSSWPFALRLQQWPPTLSTIPSKRLLSHHLLGLLA